MVINMSISTFHAHDSVLRSMVQGTTQTHIKSCETSSVLATLQEVVVGQYTYQMKQFRKIARA